MIKNSKQRAYLRSLAMSIDPVVQVGKAGITPELTKGALEALTARELIKVSVLKSCTDDIRDIAQTLSERTHSEIVHIIVRKIILYKEGKEDKKKIILP